MQALYVLDGNDIASGKKHAIVTSSLKGIEGTRALLVKIANGCKVAGIIIIGKPEELSLSDFDDKQTVHNISPIDRRRWWPENKSLFLYPIEEFAPLRQDVFCALPSGAGMKTTTVAYTPNIDHQVILDKTKLASGRYLYSYGYISNN